MALYSSDWIINSSDSQETVERIARAIVLIQMLVNQFRYIRNYSLRDIKKPWRGLFWGNKGGKDCQWCYGGESPKM